MSVQEQEPIPFIVREKQEFTLFPSEHTLLTVDSESGIPLLKARALLQHLGKSGIMYLPIDIFTTVRKVKKGRAYVPYNPEFSYPIDQQDYKPQSRLAKYRRRAKEFSQTVNPSKAPINVEIDIQSDDIGHFSPDYDTDYLLRDAFELASRVRVILTLPDTPYQNSELVEGKAMLGYCGFDHTKKTYSCFLFYLGDFYPAEFGPLAINYDLMQDFKWRRRFSHGLFLCLPQDPRPLNISAMVILSKEEGLSLI